MRKYSIALLAIVSIGCGKKSSMSIENSHSETTMKQVNALQSVSSGIPAPMDLAKAPADAQKTKSGLAYEVLRKGFGTENPIERSTVEVHYTGWTSDGEMFDSSVERGVPAKFPLNGVIEGWTEGLQLMIVGEKTRFWIPEDIAYKGRPGAPAGMLIFDIELLSMTTPPAPPETPDHLAEAPIDSQKTPSGLAYKVLSTGTGTENPIERSIVEVHYTGWTSDGTLFDSSVVRDTPAEFPLDQVIAGWTEGLQLMTVGE
jgi:peptidylprolyl isomerase